MIRTTIRTLLVLSSAALGALASNAAETKLEYNRDVRPMLAENCFACHGADSASRKAGLRLDRRDDAVKAKALVPGQPNKSAAIVRVFSTDLDEQMPPATA